MGMGFFTDTMTVYNYRREADGEHCYRTVVHGVQWRHGKRRVTASNGVFTDEPEESITVNFQWVYEANKPFLTPQEYCALPEEQAEDYWTLDPRNGMDVVVCGEVAQEVNADYGVSQLRKDYPAFDVVAVADNRNRPRLKHIKVVAK